MDNWANWCSSTDDSKKTAQLLSLDGAKKRLQLFKANLLEQGSIDFDVEGCEGVFHTASPFYHDVKDPEVHLFILFFVWFVYEIG